MESIRANWIAVARYIAVSFAGLAFAAMGVWMLVQIGIARTMAYLVTMTLLYTFDYVVTLRWVFDVRHDKTRLVRYAAYISGSWVLGTVSFHIISWFVGSVVLAVATNLVILFPIRFIVSRAWVYRDR